MVGNKNKENSKRRKEGREVIENCKWWKKSTYMTRLQDCKRETNVIKGGVGTHNGGRS